MDVVHPENSSNTCWEGGEIRILSGFHFTRGIFGFDWLRHAGAQPELPALPDPQTSRKNRNRDSGPLRKRSRMPPGPRLSPRGRENHQKRFFGGFWAEKGPKMGSESGRLGSPESLKNRLGKIFSHSVIDI